MIIYELDPDGNAIVELVHANGREEIGTVTNADPPGVIRDPNGWPISPPVLETVAEWTVSEIESNGLTGLGSRAIIDIAANNIKETEAD